MFWLSSQIHQVQIFNRLKHLPKSDKPNGISSESIYLWLDWLKINNSISTYSCFYKILQLFTIIPVTSCTCERVFSKMTIMKSKLRSTMKQERLDSLLLLFTEQELTSGINLDSVIDEFNTLENRRMIL
jgi:hypothetical protein